MDETLKKLVIPMFFSFLCIEFECRFCYFGILSLISKSPIGPIICKSAKKCLPNSLLLCDLFKTVLD